MLSLFASNRHLFYLCKMYVVMTRLSELVDFKVQLK